MTHRTWFIFWSASIVGGLSYGWISGQKDAAKLTPRNSIVIANETRNASVGSRSTRIAEEILRESNPAKRRQALADFAGAGGEAVIVEAMGSLKTTAKTPRQSEALDELFHEWGKIAPLNALKALVGEPQRTQWRWQTQILTGWADVDSPAAWAWLQQNVPVETAGTLFQQGFRFEQYSAVIDYLLKNDRPREVESLLAATSNSKVQQTVSAGLVKYFANYDLAGGVAWLNEQPPGATRKNAVATITTSIAAQAPDIAIPFAMGFAEAGDRMQAVRTAFEAAGKAEDYSAATRWILTQKAAPLEMDAALNGFVPAIASRDPDLAIKLINERSGLGDRVDLVEKAVANVRMASLDKALSLIVGVPVNPKRAEQLTTVVKLWATRDPEVAHAAIDGQPALTSSERESLLRLIPVK
jgi:hypothetical protein